MIAICVATALWWPWIPGKDRALFEAKHLIAPGDMIDVAGLRLHVRDSRLPTTNKDTPAVIFHHGLGGSLHTWEPRTQVLAEDLRTSGLNPFWLKVLKHT